MSQGFTQSTAPVVTAVMSANGLTLTSGTLAFSGSAYSPIAGSSSIVTVGTVTAGTWAATTIAANHGGTGVANNVASTLTISGSFGTTLTVTGTTALTLPTAGTLAILGANTYTGLQTLNGGGTLNGHALAFDGIATLQAGDTFGHLLATCNWFGVSSYVYFPNGGYFTDAFGGIFGLNNGGIGYFSGLSSVNMNGIQIDCGGGNIVNGGNFSLKHLVGISSAPTIAAGAGAGTGGSPAATITGSDAAGVVNVTTGTIAATGIVATITFNVAYGSAPFVVLTPANAATALLSGATMIYLTRGTTTFVINSGSTGITAAGTAYAWFYHVIG